MLSQIKSLKDLERKEMINDCIPDKSIILNYHLMTDNQLEVNVVKGYQEAINEKARRIKQVNAKTALLQKNGLSSPSTRGRRDKLEIISCDVKLNERSVSLLLPYLQHQSNNSNHTGYNQYPGNNKHFNCHSGFPLYLKYIPGG